MRYFEYTTCALGRERVGINIERYAPAWRREPTANLQNFLNLQRTHYWLQNTHQILLIMVLFKPGPLFHVAKSSCAITIIDRMIS